MSRVRRYSSVRALGRLPLSIELVCVSVLPLLTPANAVGQPSWPAALQAMALPAGFHELNRSNCIEVMLDAFRSNTTVKALIFMPGATDEFYMFKRARALVTNDAPTLFDAMAALTNQTLIRATFRPPLLLLHTDEDPLEPAFRIEDTPSAAKFRGERFLPHILVNDRDWDTIQPLLKKQLKADVRPWRKSYDSWHFYRHSFAGWNLTKWEALEAVAAAGKTKFTLRKHRWPMRSQILFEGDERVRAVPVFKNTR